MPLTIKGPTDIGFLVDMTSSSVKRVYCRDVDEVVAVVRHRFGAPHRTRCPLCRGDGRKAKRGPRLPGC